MIRRIVARLPRSDAVRVGPGDDAAVLTASDGRVVASTDLLIESRHFRRDWSSAYDIGRKAAAANLADVAAMGARPTALLVGLAVPADVEVSWVELLADGLRDECDLVGASVVGGDLSAGEAVTIAVTALGDLEGRAPVTRAGARVGDQVVLAGRLGYAAAGLALLEAGLDDDPLTDAHRRPEPPYDRACALAESGATAMIDVSDGLLADLGHIARASGVRIELDAASLLVPDELRAAGHELAVDPMEWVASGGDDHAFAATLPVQTVGDWHVIGRVVEGEPWAGFTDREAVSTPGHEHFR